MWKDAAVFITGAGSGIGRAMALEVSRRGARVAVADIDTASARAVAAECGPGAVAFTVDVRDAEAVRTTIIEFDRASGRLDVLINNAGIGVAGEAHLLGVAHWDRIIDVNIRGVVHGVATAYPLMVERRHGHIVNTASLAGLGPAPLFSPYAMTKHAVVGLSTSLRAEAKGFGVRVSVLCPAAIETPILDSSNPADLPEVPRLDSRSHLERLGGKVYPLDKMVAEALRGIEKNKGIIVIPRKARLLWRAGRLFPGLVEKACVDAVAAQRKSSGASSVPAENNGGARR